MTNYLSARGNVYGLQLISTTASIAPIVVSSSNIVSNLNVQYLGGQPNSYYTNATNINSGTLNPQFGGTGLSSLNMGQFIYASQSNSLGQTANLVYDSVNSNIKINQLNISTTSQVPLIISSSNMVSNLNVQYLNGQPASYYANSSNLQGIISVCNGGTGLSSLSMGFVPFGQGQNSLGFSSNFFWNNSSNFLGIGNSNPQYSIDVVGSVNVTQSLLINGVSVNAGLQLVQKGGTGLSNVQSGYILFGQDSNQLNTSSSLIFNSNTQQLSVQSISITSNFSIFTSNLISNLNTQYLCNQPASYYTNATNISSGVLGVSYGGTGLTQLQQGQLVFANSSNSLGQSSNVVYDQTNSNLKFNQANITLPASNTNQAPLIVSNSNLVSNLNVQYFNSQGSSYYTNANNIQSGVLGVTYGGTGLYSLSQGFIPFGGGVGANQVPNSLSYSSNLFWDSSNFRLGIRNWSPQHTIDVVGDISCTQNIYVSNQLVSSIGTGIAPFSIASSTLVYNLNVQYLNNQVGSFYTNASNISSGILNPSFGGTGITSMSTGQIHFGSNGILGQSSNLYWNNSSNNLGVGNSNPQYSIDVVGSVNVTQSLLINGVSVNAGLQVVQKGGTGLSNIQAGYILFGQDSNQLNTSSNLTFNTTNQQLIVSNVSVSNLSIQSSNQINNLNAQYLGSQPANYYTNATNIQYGVLGVSYGGTGLTSLQQGQLIFASASNSLGQNSNVSYDQANSNLKITQANITLAASNSSQAPLIVSNSNLVSNLNVQYLGGQPNSYYTNAYNISSGILNPSFGGTGITTMTNGFIHFGSNNILGQSSNLFWNNTSNFLGIGNSNPQYSIDVVGSVNVTQSLLINGISVNAGLQVVQKGGTGLSNVQAGYILFGQDSNQLNTSSNLLFNTSNQQLLVQNIYITQNLNISTSNLINNLNAQYLGGQSGSYYTNVANVSAGVLGVSFGGTGVSSLQQSQLIFASSSNSFGQTSNIVYDQINSNLRINQANITLSASNTSQSPFIVSNSNLVSNLNVQYLNSQPGSYYTNATNISTGVLAISQGGTGLSVLSQGFIPFGQGSSPMGSSSNLYWDSINIRLGIRNPNPQHAIDVIGNIICSSNIYLCNQFISSLGVGTAPFSISSTTLVCNLNVQYLNSNPSTYYTNATNISSGILSLSYGGTGFSYLQSGYIPFGQGSSPLGSSSNLFWNSTSNFLGIGTSLPAYPLHNSGITYTAGAIISSNYTVNCSGLHLQWNKNNLGKSYIMNQKGSSSNNTGGICFGEVDTSNNFSQTMFLQSNGYLGLGTLNPGYVLDVAGNINASSNVISSNQFVSTVSTTPPFSIISSNLVSNLNVQYLNGNPASYYTNASNISSGILAVSQGGTGLSQLSQGFIPFGQGQVSLGCSSNLFWNSTSNFLGINTSTPSNAIDVVGNIRASSNIASSNQFVSTIATGTAPFSVTSTTLVYNLNVQYLSGCNGAFYTNASNINAGILNVLYGGTGVSTMMTGYLHFGSSTGVLGQSSNLFWNSTSNFLGINTSTPINALDVVGNIRASSNIISSNYLGIGTSAPAYPLHNTGTSYTAVAIISGCNTVQTSGLNLQWNRSNLGSSYIMNQKGSSSNSTGGISFGEVDTSNNFSLTMFLSSNGYLGVGLSNPSNSVDVVGNIRASSNIISSNQFMSTVAVGTSPFSIASTTLVTNLNVQYLNNQSGSYYTNATNINSGVLNVSYGGTGITSVSNGFLLVASNNTFAQSSNLFYNFSSNFFGINTSNPAYPLDINGNTNIKGNLTVTGSIIINSTGSGSSNTSTNSNALTTSNGILSVTSGGTGLSNIPQGYLLFGSSSSPLGSTSNLCWNSTSNFLGIGTSNPLYTLDVSGSIRVSSNIYFSNQFVSSVASGTAPLSITSTTIVSNLNVQYLNGQLGSYYTNASNILAGTLNVSYGGTGLNTIIQGYIPFGQNSNSLASTSNLFWNTTSNYLGIGTSTPSNAIDVVGNIRASSNVIVSNYLGVATSTPSNAIDVIGNIRASSNIISSNQFVSGVSTGTAPLSITSTTLVSNLNVQYLNGQLGTYYTNASNISSGTLSLSYGGTGLNTLTQGYIPFGQGSNAIGSTSNLFWNSTSNYLGIGTTTPGSMLDIGASSNTSLSLRGQNTQQYIYPLSNGGRSEIGFCSQITGGPTWYIGQSTGTSISNSFAINCGSLSSNVLTALSNGYIGIGNSNPQYTLDVSGTLNCTTITQNQPLSLCWIFTSNLALNGNTVIPYSNWVYQSNMSKIPSNVSQSNILQSNSNIVIPINGIYTITYLARFSNMNYSNPIENSTWLNIVSGSYINTSNYNNGRFCHSSTTAFNTASTVSGYFQSNDTFTPYAFSGISNYLIAGYGGVNLQITLLYRC